MRAFHINPDEAVDGDRVIQQFLHHLTRQCFVHIQSHVGQLQTHVGIELALANLIQQLMIESFTAQRLFAIRYTFAQVIHRDANPHAIPGHRRQD